MSRVVKAQFHCSDNETILITMQREGILLVEMLRTEYAHAYSTNRGRVLIVLFLLVIEACVTGPLLLMKSTPCTSTCALLTWWTTSRSWELRLDGNWISSLVWSREKRCTCSVNSISFFAEASASNVLEKKILFAVNFSPAASRQGPNFIELLNYGRPLCLQLLCLAEISRIPATNFTCVIVRLAGNIILVSMFLLCLVTFCWPIVP